MGKRESKRLKSAFRGEEVRVTLEQQVMSTALAIEALERLLIARGMLKAGELEQWRIFYDSNFPDHSWILQKPDGNGWGYFEWRSAAKWLAPSMIRAEIRRVNNAIIENQRLMDNWEFIQDEDGTNG